MKKVYVAGKLNDDAVGYIKNLYVMIKYANKLRRMGFAVFVPGLDFLMGFLDGNFSYKDYFENSQPFLEVCDIVFVCPNYRTSTGTKKEIKRAKQLKIPIFYSLYTLENTKF